MPGSPTTPATWPRPVSTGEQGVQGRELPPRPTNGLSTRSPRSHPGVGHDLRERCRPSVALPVLGVARATASRRAIPRTKRAVVSLHRICPGAACSWSTMATETTSPTTVDSSVSSRPPPTTTKPVCRPMRNAKGLGTRSRRSWCTCNRRWSSNATRTARGRHPRGRPAPQRG